MSRTPTTGDTGAFGPEQAAALLEETTQRARRTFEPLPPWLLVARAVMVLAALGAVWLSVRGQHPYQGPTAVDIPVLVAFVVLNFVATVAVRRHAIAGVSGASRFSQGEITVMVLSFVATLVAIVGLYSAGLTFAAYPTSVLVIPGLVWMVLMVARSNWRGLATGVAIVAIGVVGAFAGPAGSWAVAGVGLCLVLLGQAAVIARSQHG